MAEPGAKTPQGRGRWSTLTTKVRNDVITAIQANATYEIACEYAGIPYRTFLNWMKWGREENERLVEARGNLYAWLQSDDYSRQLNVIPPKRRGRPPKNAPAQPPQKPFIVPPDVVNALRPGKGKRIYLQFWRAVTQANSVAAVGWLQVIDAAAANDPSWAAWQLRYRFPDVYGAKAGVTVSASTTSAAGTAGAAQQTIIKIEYGDQTNAPQIVEGEMVPGTQPERHIPLTPLLGEG